MAGPGAEPDAPASSRRMLRHAIGWTLGLLLLIGAIIIVWRERATLEPALRALRDAPPMLVVALPILVISNIIFTALHLQCLLRRFGRVPTLEMQMLIAATALANYLPLRPGLVGRLVYHKNIHGIRLRDSTRTLIESAGLGLIAILLMLGLLLLAGTHEVLIGLALSAPLLLAMLIGWWCAPARLWVFAFSFKYADVLAWTGRYAIAFALVGQPIGLVPAATLAMIAMTASLVPLVSNGLGLRELIIGLLAPSVAMWGAGFALEGGSTLAIAADLVNRALEITAVTIAGLIGFIWLARQHRPQRERST